MPRMSKNHYAGIRRAQLEGEIRHLQKHAFSVRKTYEKASPTVPHKRRSKQRTSSSSSKKPPPHFSISFGKPGATLVSKQHSTYEQMTSIQRTNCNIPSFDLRKRLEELRRIPSYKELSTTYQDMAAASTNTRAVRGNSSSITSITKDDGAGGDSSATAAAVNLRLDMDMGMGMGMGIDTPRPMSARSSRPHSSPSSVTKSLMLEARRPQTSRGPLKHTSSASAPRRSKLARSTSAMALKRPQTARAASHTAARDSYAKSNVAAPKTSRVAETGGHEHGHGHSGKMLTRSRSEYPSSSSSSSASAQTRKYKFLDKNNARRAPTTRMNSSLAGKTQLTTAMDNDADGPGSRTSGETAGKSGFLILGQALTTSRATRRRRKWAWQEGPSHVFDAFEHEKKREEHENRRNFESYEMQRKEELLQRKGMVFNDFEREGGHAPASSHPNSLESIKERWLEAYSKVQQHKIVNYERTNTLIRGQASPGVLPMKELLAWHSSNVSA